jgi:hypothetical protein
VTGRLDYLFVVTYFYGRAIRWGAGELLSGLEKAQVAAQ